MTKTIHYLSILAIATILIGSISIGTVAFADDDDDDDRKKKNKVLTGDGPPPNKLGKIGDLYIDNESDDFDIYEKTGKKTWELTGDLRGEQGPEGQEGAPLLPPQADERSPRDSLKSLRIVASGAMIGCDTALVEKARSQRSAMVSARSPWSVRPSGLPKPSVGSRGCIGAGRRPGAEWASGEYRDAPARCRAFG